ncbi:peptidyl-prolyl cis-trans isomerase [candidate division WOR-3 bacterium]|nr:peptidyl-prolyl cis-trans isomerase [candidate division WOR-3 bacterium]
MKSIFSAIIFSLFASAVISGSSGDFFFSSDNDTTISFSDIITYRNFIDSTNFSGFFLLKYYSLEAYENGLALEESLSLEAIARETLYKHAYSKYGRFDFTPVPEYLDSVHKMSAFSVRGAFICTKDSLLAEKVRTELSGYTELGDSLFTAKTESLFFEYADPRISGIAEVSWENVMYPLRDALFSLEDFSVGPVIRFPTFYVVPVRLQTKEKDPILPDTMNADWLVFVTSLSQTDYKIKSILEAIEIAKPVYVSSTMDLFVMADSAKFDTIPFPMFPQISREDSLRTVCRYLDDEMSAGEMMLRFRRRGLFPRLGDTVNLRFEIERQLILEDAFTMPHLENLRNDPLIASEIELLQNEFLYNLLKKRIEDTVFVDMEEMRAFYERNKENYLLPERLGYSIFLSGDSSFSDSIKNLVVRGFSFDSLARLHSTHTTAKEGGAAGYRARDLYGTLQPVMQDMNKGDVSDLFKTIDGWAFVKVTEIIPPAYQPFDSIQVRIKNETRNEKLEKTFMGFMEYLKMKHHVVININSLVLSFLREMFFHN